MREIDAFFQCSLLLVLRARIRACEEVVDRRLRRKREKNRVFDCCLRTKKKPRETAFEMAEQYPMIENGQRSTGNGGAKSLIWKMGGERERK